MLSSCLFALRGFSRLSIKARRSLVSSASEVNRNFFTQLVDFFPDSLDCQRTSIRHRSSRSRRGLYDGKDIRSGNNVSFSMKSSKRTFKPNVFKKRVYSEILDEMILFHLTTSALRSIDKAGGLDSYLLTSRHVTEGEGLEAKKRILKVLKAKKRMEPRLAEGMAQVEEEKLKADDDDSKSRKDEK